MHNHSRSTPVLETLSMVCERLAHSISTPLGVSLGIVDDLINGHELGEQDYRDARDSLQRIVNLLVSIRDIGSRPTFDPKPMDLNELLSEQATLAIGLGAIQKIELHSFPAVPKFSVDHLLFIRALKCLLRYLLKQNQSSSKTAEATAELVNITLVVAPKGVPTTRSSSLLSEPPALAIRFGPPIAECIRSQQSVISLPSVVTLRELATLDHSLEALGLIYAEEVFVMHGGGATVEMSSDDQAQVLIWLGK